jgi:hypothetical protein
VVISFFLMIIAIPLYLRCFVKFVTSKQIIWHCLYRDN